MTPHKAQSIGRTKTIKATLVCLAIPLLILLFMETRGDFANGILFYIHGVFTGENLIHLLIILSLTFLFGGWAGREIIISKKNTIITAIKYTALVYLGVYLYLVITYKPPSMHLAFGDKPNLFLHVASSSIHLTIILLVAWLYATYRLGRASLKNQTS
jgi:hypothetical protein